MDTQPQNQLNNSAEESKATILTIEDDALVRQSFVMFLEDYGFDVIEAVDGEAGLNAFDQSKPDLVLCDIRMPKMSGMEVLQQISQRSPETPVIMISGAGMINDVVESLRLGAFDYIVKPITDFGVLEHAVNQALNKKQLEQENKVFRSELERANRELQSNLETLQEDQDAARRAQLQLLPEPESTFGQFSFMHTVIPSLNVSGDFVDYFEIDEQYLGFYIADVSGHGSASAFVTMMLKSLFNQPLRTYRASGDKTILDPAAVMRYLNQEIITANVGKHVTMFYGVIDTSQNRLDYCVAGQFPRPLIVTEGQRRILQDRGFPLGLFDWVSFESKSLEFLPGQSVVMFSDGVLESIREGEVCPEEALLNIPISKSSTVLGLIDQIGVRSIETLSDDVTIFIVRHNDQ
ncbi:MAG: SpoIIE family protein phosphatase [Gammaproteobacteria bacterium]|nr:SpoIIE family protein phosphatase [Gammaproteobacteria bacterium]